MSIYLVQLYESPKLREHLPRINYLMNVINTLSADDTYRLYIFQDGVALFSHELNSIIWLHNYHNSVAVLLCKLRNLILLKLYEKKIIPLSDTSTYQLYNQIKSKSYGTK